MRGTLSATLGEIRVAAVLLPQGCLIGRGHGASSLKRLRNLASLSAAGSGVSRDSLATRPGFSPRGWPKIAARLLDREARERGRLIIRRNLVGTLDQLGDVGGKLGRQPEANMDGGEQLLLEGLVVERRAPP